MKQILSLFFFVVGGVGLLNARPIIYDTKACSVYELFSQQNATYIIQYTHQFKDTLFIPIGSRVRFNGGRLSGPIKFNNTLLSGAVDLHGASISGHLRNKTFNASWICAKDGKTDDAKSINEVIAVCGNIYFPKGQYYLMSTFDPAGTVDKSLYKAVAGHIGISRSDVHLKGGREVEFITSSEVSTISVYSKPYDIANNVRDIIIERIKFTVINDGQRFHQWMHTIKFIGVNNAQVKRCVFNDFHGDAICLDHYGDNPATGERTRNQNVTIYKNKIIGGEFHNNRNGISVINGKNILIKSNIIKNTSRFNMPGGIDVEPNNSAYTVENINIIGNYLEEVRGKGGAINVITNIDGPIHSIRIEKNRINSCNLGIQLYITSAYTSDNFIISNNIVSDNTPSYLFYGKGKSRNWEICNNIFEQPSNQIIPGKIQVENLIINGNKLGKK